MKSIAKIMLLVAVLVSSGNAAEYRKPLVSISFNSSDVQYQKSLSYAAGKALEVKKDVVFDVVTYGQYGSFYGNQVADHLVKIGVNANNITLTQGQFSNKSAVLVFVR